MTSPADTAARLRELADKAPAGPWRVFAGAGGFVRAADGKTVATDTRGDSAAILVALAPELAAWAADAAEELQSWAEIQLIDVVATRALLSRFAQLTGQEPA